ncbi:hypothetical protein OG226_33265 [Streptomyces sp. NBC_01261]|uniref:hypothetical protein n=1 Tax=Streptomyces sp. NBC_01261 TaxID=2903802 RepID=UPI002E32A43C|nr:hypothetical protein [Streptomyces sp. NBC_01261]
MGTTFRTAAVSALALGSLTVAAGSQVHAATATSHSTTDDSARTQKQKAEAVADAAKGQVSRPVTDPEAVRILKMKTIAMAHAPKG